MGQNRLVFLILLVVLAIIVVFLTFRASRKEHHHRRRRRFHPDIPVNIKEWRFPFRDGQHDADALFVGMGSVGAPAFREMADRGLRVGALCTGHDQQENPVVQKPFEVSQFQGTGAFNLNIINALFDPDITVFEGNPAGPGDGWSLKPNWLGQGPAGGGNHYFCDGVWPLDEDLDGPLQAGSVKPGDFVHQALAEAGGPKWSSTVIKGIIRNKVETLIGPGGPPLSENVGQRGTTGPLGISQFSGPPAGDQYDMQEAMSYAATQVDPSYNIGSVPLIEDYNLQQNPNGVSQLQFLMKFDPEVGDVVRQNAATAFLSRRDFDLVDGDLVGRNDLKAFVKTDAYVVKVVFEKSGSKQKAIGVLAFIDQELRFIRAKNIILAAGAAKTPRLLEVSGIGSAPILSKYKITPKVTLPAVGENLRNQYGGRMVFSTTDPDYSFNFFGQAFAGYNGAPRVFQFIHLGLGPQSYGQVIGNPYPDTNLFYSAIECFMAHPRSKGRIHVTTSNMGDHPALDWGLFSDGPDPNDPYSGLGDVDSDIYKCCVSLDYMYQIMLRLQSVNPGANFQITYPPVDVLSIPDRATRFHAMVPYLTHSLSLAAHEIGTCVMNNDPALGVVDDSCRVHGTESLFITDGSIMPCETSGNPAMGLMAVGINAGGIIADIISAQ